MQNQNLLTPLESPYNEKQHSAFAEAVNQQVAITPLLLSHLSTISNDSNAAEDNIHLSVHTLLLLAQFKEEQAYPLVIQLLRALDDDHPLCDGMLGQMDFARVLGSVCGTDFTAIYQLIEDDSADPFARCCALESLLVLHCANKLERKTIEAYFRTLFDGKLTRESNIVWDCLVQNCEFLLFNTFIPHIEKALDESLLVLPLFDISVIKESIKTAEAKGEAQLGGYEPITDAVGEIAYISQFHEQLMLLEALNSDDNGANEFLNAFKTAMEQLDLDKK